MRVKVILANGTTKEFQTTPEAADRFFAAFWDLSYPVDPELTPDAPLNLSLENGDFICRVVVSDFNRDEYGDQARQFACIGRKVM